MEQPDFFVFPVLDTDRLMLRKPSLDDANGIYLLRSDADVAAHTGKVPFVGIGEAFAYIDKIENLISKGECIYWVVSYRNSSDLIGAICIWNFDVPNATVEIGYELLPQFQGKGIMGEVIPCILHYAFNVMDVKTVVAFPSSENPSSVKLLEKSGFKLAPDSYMNTHENVPGMLTYIFSSL